MAKRVKKSASAATPPASAPVASKPAMQLPKIELVEAPEVIEEPDEVQLFPARDYLILNAVFFVFCIIQVILAKIVLREIRGLYFFFGLLVIGFAAVSVFDYIYDRMVVRRERRTGQPEA